MTDSTMDLKQTSPDTPQDFYSEIPAFKETNTNTNTAFIRSAKEYSSLDIARRIATPGYNLAKLVNSTSALRYEGSPMRHNESDSGIGLQSDGSVFTTETLGNHGNTPDIHGNTLGNRSSINSLPHSPVYPVSMTMPSPKRNSATQPVYQNTDSVDNIYAMPDKSKKTPKVNSPQTVHYGESQMCENDLYQQF